ncbi:MAG: hypothetical protein ASARMPREDX12_000958 [Alectoria sarmentosa]|nr:MAG: hypothetical protein ASARMPREDX12_000958 [Alectoria sarmentosa]
MMDSPQSNPTSTPRYVPPQRRPTYNDQPYLTYEDLHTRYSPPNSPRLRMPQIQRSLSAEDLYQRFQENQSERQPTNQESQSQESHNSPASSPPPPLRDLEALKTYRQFQQQKNESENQPPNQEPQGQKPFDNPASSPPPPLRDLEALRTHRSPTRIHRPPASLSSRSEQPLRPILSPKLPDPPVFNGTDKSKFEDWKLRIQDKLSLNKDHYPTDAFQVNYVISRLNEKASEHTMHRRRNATTNPYLSIKNVLNQLSDLYETPLHLLQEANAHVCEGLKQGVEQPFPKFYTEFMRYAANDQSQKRQLIRCLKDNIIKRLRETHMMMSTERD